MSLFASNEVTSLADLLKGIHDAFENKDVCVDRVNDLLSSYKSNPKDWKKFVKFDRCKYTRNLIDLGTDKFNVMLLCWGPSHQSSIHDHSDAHCFMKIMDGSLEEERYEWPSDDHSENSMVSLGTTPLKENGVVYMNDSLGLHRVANPSHSDNAVSLHIYSPPFDACHAFDERTGKKLKCKVTFHSKDGVKVQHCGKNN